MNMGKNIPAGYTALAVALLIAGSGAVAPAIWKMPALPATLAILLGAIIYAGKKIPTPGTPATEIIPKKVEAGLVLAFTLAAFLLRVPNLNTNPPGILVDEAYQGLQGMAHWTGEKLPAVAEHETPPDYPFWSLIEAVSTKTLGVSINSIRLPAAIIGSLTIPLAWLVTRALFGSTAGIISALFLCGSFWHVHNSRLALPLAPLAAESLALGWLLLAAGIRDRKWAPVLAGALCGYSIFGYSAAMQLPLWGLVVTIGGAIIPREGKRNVYAPAAFAIALALVIGLVSIYNPVTRQLGRTQSLITKVAQGVETARPQIIANFFSTVEATNGQWANHPRGAPRLALFERILLVLGLAGLLSSTSIPGRIKWAIPAWLICSLLPELVPGGVHLSRGLGALAPLAVIMGLAGWTLARLGGRKGLVLALALGLANMAATARHIYGNFPLDPQARSWYQFAELESSADIREIGQLSPVKTLGEALSYKLSPTQAFLLWNEVQEGRIILEDHFNTADLHPLPRFYEDPYTRDPLIFIMVGPDYPQDRRILVTTIMQVLVHGEVLEQQGKLREAEGFYREMLGALPPSRYTQMRLADLMERTGKR